MYQTLWNSINKQVKNSHASAAFLAISLTGWTTIGLLAGFFFGGILYLYRTEPRHSTDSAPSQVPTVSQISLNAKTAAR